MPYTKCECGYIDDEIVDCPICGKTLEAINNVIKSEIKPKKTSKKNE